VAVAEPTLSMERRLFRQGYESIIGCDEVGRGAIAGPVSVGVVSIPRRCGRFPEGLRDSKLLAPARREALLPGVVKWVSGWAIGESSADEIDDSGIIAGLGRAASRGIERLVDQGVDLATSVVLLDGKHDWLTPALGEWAAELTIVTRIKADRDCASVSAASVLAKVGRDGQMVRHHDEFADYAWDSNKGYGSAAHWAGLDRVGPSPLHRVTWLSKPREAVAAEEPAAPGAPAPA
jgi:ribonuclease HII